MFCDILLPDGSPSWADPRHVLRRALSQAAEKGFTFYTHPEIEFFLLQDVPAGRRRCPTPVDTGGYFDHTTHAVARDFRRQAVLALERIGISVEFSHHEVAPGQQEIDLRYADALTTADNIMTFRHVVKEVALSHGVHATFMPKPFTDQPGSGMHTHLSLFEGERNAFHDAGDPMKLSKVGQGVHRRPARRTPGSTPRSPTSGSTRTSGSSRRRCRTGSPRRRRTSAGATSTGPRWSGCRPTASRTRPGSRSARSTRRCNPYLAFAVLLGAGLKGIEEGYELPPGAEDDVWSLSDAERRAMGYEALPENLAEAIDVMAGSELVAEVLGEHVFDFFLRNKRAEWEEYRREVTPYERQRYLSL